MTTEIATITENIEAIRARVGRVASAGESIALADRALGIKKDFLAQT